LGFEFGPQRIRNYVSVVRARKHVWEIFIIMQNALGEMITAVLIEFIKMDVHAFGIILPTLII
jgi:hypothetical protein